MSAFYQKHFLKLLDFTPAEITALLELAAKLKADKKNGIEVQKLAGKNIALIFERLNPYTMLFRSCRIRSRRPRDLSGAQRQPDWP